MNSNFVLYNKKKEVKEKSQKFGLSPLTSVILCNRDIFEDDSIKKILSTNLSDLNESKLLPDVDKACGILQEFIKEKKNIRIVGDYDVDGVCATYILYDSLKKLNVNVSYHLPDRFQDGYGINKNIIDKAISDKIDLIITCDNGIAANAEITYANENGISVIVTDHHDINEIPIDAKAVVDPKRVDVENLYPFDGICGTTVAMKFVDRYFELYENKKDYIIDNYLEFACIATVSDIMPLTNENHIIVKVGLDRILKTKNKGLKKLLDRIDIDWSAKGITTYNIGFMIGPLINAAGRMKNAAEALKLFISEDENEIEKISFELKNLNEERKLMTDTGALLAMKKIEECYSKDKVLLVYVENLGEQVAGIVAGRIKDKYNKPTIVLTDTVEADVAKASCRSIEAYDIFEALNKHNDMLLKFGGHKLAAGFSILKKDIDELRKLLNDESLLTESDFAKKVYIDAEFPFYDMNEEVVRDLEKLEPFGQKFNRYQFATKNVKTTILNVYGNSQNVVKLSFEKDEKKLSGVLFEDASLIKARLSESDRLDIVYYPRINEYKGFKSIELSIVAYR